MICPKCGKENNSKICSDCNIDMDQYILVDNMSIESYNKGLTFAKAGDMSNAILHLKKSVKYNCHSLTALNLLGLCYDKIGQIADASMYWIRSCLIIEDNVAADYLKSVEDNLSKRETLNDSIKMYNQSLVYLRQQNYDIATIQLKKSVEKNPDFVEAYNLLTLCYISSNEIDKAILSAKKAISIDAGNEKTLRYLSELGVSSAKSINNASPKKIKRESEKPAQKNYAPVQISKPRSSFFGPISFLLGALFVFLFMTFLVLPAAKSTGDQQLLDAQTQFKNAEDTYKSQVETLNSQIEKLDNDYNALSEENKKNIDELSKQKVINALSNASQFLNSGDYSSAASAIASIDVNSLDTKDIDKYNSIKDSSYKKASRASFDKAVREYQNGNYQNSLDLLNSVVTYGGDTISYYDNVIYYMARDYEGLGDKENAKKYYQQIIDNYPKSNIFYTAKSRLAKVS